MASHLLASLIVGWAGGAEAQVGMTTDIITGVVTDVGGAPSANVTIEALSLETQISRTTTTDARGRFTILFPDGGGQYRVSPRTGQLAPLIRRFHPV